MDVHLNSLNVRFWRRRETILRPVLWSPEDLRLFGCQFGDIHTSRLQGRPATRVEDSSAATGHELREREALILQRCHSSPCVKESCMVNILADNKLYRSYRGPPPLRIEARTIHSVPKARRDGNRRKLRPGQRDSDYIERLKRITPRDWSEDPYFLSILLSIAQRQYYHRLARRNTVYRVCLFVTNTASPQDIIFFDVDIPTALLDELNDPRMVPQQQTRLVIHRTRMSIEPCKDFWARLVAALSGRGVIERRGDGEGRRDGADEEGCQRQEM